MARAEDPTARAQRLIPLATVGVLALAFGAAAVLLVRGLLRAATTAPAPLAQTRAALRDDYEALAGAVAPERSAGPHE